MDNVQAVKNMTENFPGVASTITYVANPEYLKFTEPNQLKILKGENLIIEVSEFSYHQNQKYPSYTFKVHALFLKVIVFRQQF